MAVSNLYAYYTQNGGTYNTWDSAKRQADATSAGITNYTGTAQQNTQLLGFLQSPTSSITSTPAPAPTPTINSTTLSPTPSVNYQTPVQAPLHSASTVDVSLPDQQLTAPETELQKQIQSLMTDNSALVGRDAYQAEQEAKYGLSGFLDTQKSLSKRILALQAQEKSIPDQMQVDAEGRGITAAGLAPITAGELRKNSIQANILGAQLAASQLDVASANDLVQKAVGMKFGPIEESQKAKLANLALLLKDPALSLADRNRAQQQITLQQQKGQQVEQAKLEYTAIHNIAIDAAKNGADAVTLQKITNAQTYAEALQIAASTGFTGFTHDAAQSQLIGSSSAGYYNYNPATGTATPVSGYNTPSVSTTGTTSTRTGTRTGSTAAPTTSTYKFTSTQLNTGANKAALSIDAFKAMPPDVQNYFVNTSATAIEALTSLLGEVKSGTKSAAEIKSLIDSSNLTQAVKDYWAKKLAEVTPATAASTSSGSFLGNVWSGIKSWFGNL